LLIVHLDLKQSTTVFKIKTYLAGMVQMINQDDSFRIWYIK